jgi:hypothetical protein
MNQTPALPLGFHEGGLTAGDYDELLIKPPDPLYDPSPVCTCSTTHICGEMYLQCDPGCRAETHTFDWRQP